MLIGHSRALPRVALHDDPQILTFGMGLLLSCFVPPSAATTCAQLPPAQPQRARGFTVVRNLDDGRSSRSASFSGGSGLKLMHNEQTNELVAAILVPWTPGQVLSLETHRTIVNQRKLKHPNVVQFREA